MVPVVRGGERAWHKVVAFGVVDCLPFRGQTGLAGTAVCDLRLGT
jgi:hypothetical protein